MSRAARSLGLVSLGLLLNGAPGRAALTTDIRVQQLLKEAEGFSATGRYDLATRRCEQAIKLDPANESAHALLWKVKRADAVQKTREKAEAKVIRPTYPPQHHGQVPGSPLFR